MDLAKGLWEISVQNFRNLVCFGNLSFIAGFKFRTLRVSKIGIFVTIIAIYTRNKMLARVLDLPLNAHVFDERQVRALELDVSFLYLIKSKFHRFSFYITAEQPFQMLDIIKVSKNNFLNPILVVNFIRTSYWHCIESFFRVC